MFEEIVLKESDIVKVIKFGRLRKAGYMIRTEQNGIPRNVVPYLWHRESWQTQIRWEDDVSYDATTYLGSGTGEQLDRANWRILLN